MKAFADNADTGVGWGVQNLGKLADVILAHSLSMEFRLKELLKMQ